MTERRSDILTPLAIICAGGAIPFAVADSLKAQGRHFVLLALQGIADPIRVADYPHYWVGIGQYGRIRRLARAEGCVEMVLIGSLVRPSLWKVRLDFAGLLRMPRVIAAYRGGDDHLLRCLGRILEADGFRIIGAHEVAPQLLMPEGVLTARAPSELDRADIVRGLEVLHAIGRLDIGQATVVAGGQVLALEGTEGTDGMLAKVAALRVAGRCQPAAASGVLVKAPKTTQDRRYDLPAVGPRTVVSAKQAGLAGIAVVAGGGVVAELDRMIEAANRENLFIVGVKGMS